MRITLNSSNLQANGESNDYKIHFHTMLLGIYLAIAPFEDLLVTQYGTIAKYLAYGIFIVAIIYLLRMQRIININSIWLTPAIIIAISWLSVVWSVNRELTVERNIAYTLLPSLFILCCWLQFNKQEKRFIENSILLGGIICFLQVLFAESCKLKIQNVALWKIHSFAS